MFRMTAFIGMRKHDIVLAVEKPGQSIRVVRDVPRWSPVQTVQASGLANQSLLIIDDEADQGSPNGSASNPDAEPTTIHKFILGVTKPAVIMLLVSLLGCGVGALVMMVIGIIEGIKYLTMSDAEFYRTYVVGKKESVFQELLRRVSEPIRGTQYFLPLGSTGAVGA